MPSSVNDRKGAESVTAEEDSRLLTTIERRVGKLSSQLDALEFEYRQAGQNLNTTAAQDVKAIREAREEAERITTILRGTELFGRYAQDADHHFRVANRWRTSAVLVLMSMPLIAVLLSTVAALGNVTAAIALAPMLALFVYASVESHNHRRREFDRRRISLRVSAIEAFTKQRRENGKPGDRKTAEDLMDDFVRKHFIEPDLDSNDMSYVGPRFSLVTVLSRNNKEPDAKPKAQ